MGGQARWQLSLDRGEALLFSKLVALGSGTSVTLDGGLNEVMDLCLMADRYQVDAVQVAVEDAVLSLLTVESCGMMLARCSGSGLMRVEMAARELALQEFDEFAKTPGFIETGEDVLGSLLDDDGLCSENEELVFGAVARWMKVRGGEEVRGLGLLGKVRFPLMDDKYLADLARDPYRNMVGLEERVAESLAMKYVARDDLDKLQFKHLDARVMVPRRGGVIWEDYIEGGERRLAAGQNVYSVVADGRYVCSGLQDGTIRVWSRSTLTEQRTLTGHSACVRTLLSFRGLLISGSADRCIRVWDVSTGRCEGILMGNADRVTLLAACGNWLVSGSWDKTVKVWGMEGEPSTWQCQRTLDGQDSVIWCLGMWGSNVASGSEDGCIRVWSLETWNLERTLRHEKGVYDLVVSGQRLISSSFDRTVRVWSTNTWECVQKLEVYPAGSVQFIHRLAVCRSTVVGGSINFSALELRRLIF